MLLCLLVFKLNVSSQTLNNLGKFFIRNYQPNEYKAHPQNWSAIQGDDGIMYFGNNDGILEYDGETWKTITGIFDVRALEKDSSGTIYAGGQNEIGYLERDEKGLMKYHSLTSQLDDSLKNFYNIPSIVKYKEGICFIAFTGMFYFENKKLKKIWRPDNEFIFGFNIDGQVFLREKEKGLLHLVNDSLVLIKNGEKFKNQPIYMMQKYDKDKIIIGTDLELMLMNIADHTITPFTTNVDDYLLKNELYHGLKLYDKYFVLVTSYGGVVVIDTHGKLVQLFNKQTGLDNNNSHFAYIDNEQNLWLTTNNGLSYIETNSAISFFDTENGYADIPTSINKYNNTYFLGTLQNFYTLKIDTVLSENSNSFFEFTPIQKESNSFIDIKIIDEELYTVYRDGIYKIENNKLKKTLSFSICYSIHQLTYNRKFLLLGTSEGLYLIRKEGNKLINLEQITDIRGAVRSIIEDKNKDIWIDINGDKIFRLELSVETGEYKVIEYDKEKGLTGNRPNVPALIHNNIYVITKNNVFEYDYNTDTFHECNTFPKIMEKNDTIKYDDMKEFGDSIFVATSSNGIGILYPDTNSAYNVDFTPFLREPSLMVFTTFIDTSKNWFWYSGTKNIYMYNINTNKKYDYPYKTLIRAVYVNDDSVISYGTYDNTLPPEFDFSNNSLSFQFSAILYEHNNATMYSYKIENLDKSWSKWSPENKVKYPNIPHGDYTFKVKAINCYGTESDIAEYHFIILPPWYFSFGAFAGYFIILALIVYGIVYLNSKRLKAINLKLEKIIDERTFEINSKNKELNKRNKLITDSIRYAKHIQEAVLPNEQILNKFFPESFIFFLPRDIVSGDFYWFSHHNDKLFIAAGDCTGHGVPGALMSIMGNTLLNEIVNEKKIYKPSVIFDHLNKRVISLLKQNEKDNQTRDDGMDISLCCFDKTKKTIEIASANHKVLIVKDNKNIIVDGDIYSIGGLFSNKSEDGFTNHVVEYTENTKIYLYSDGYQDQFGGTNNKKFMAERFEKLLIENSNLDFHTQYLNIKTNFEKWKQHNRQVDDILVIGIKV